MAASPFSPGSEAFGFSIGQPSVHGGQDSPLRRLGLTTTAGTRHGTGMHNSITSGAAKCETTEEGEFQQRVGQPQIRKTLEKTHC